MQRTNVTYLKRQIQNAIATLFANVPIADWADIKFQFYFDKSETRNTKTNWDEMMFYHILPKKVGHLLSLDEITEALTTATNEIPLFIKIKQIEPLKLYGLLISKRFRKLADIQKHHKDNPLTPLLAD